MAQEKRFVKEGIRSRDVEEFLEREFAKAGYSHSLIQRTPLSIRITVFAQKPGLIIGRGGKKIEAITQTLREAFGFENPQLDVQEIENPDLDPHIVARRMASSIERGINYKRVSHLALQRIMDAGAKGVAIRVSGKLSGEMSRTEKFNEGYLKYSGEPAESMVGKAYAVANIKPGTIGIQVRIMKEAPKELEAIEKVEVKEKLEGEEVGNIEEKTA